jgi:hypothetical protein
VTKPAARPGNTLPIIIGVCGILVEGVAVALLASKRISTTFGTPLIVAGMLLAFVPLFILARRARQK